jgi:membrane protease YdiL (CAAX protease family)
MAAVAYGIHYLGTKSMPSQITGLVGAAMTFMGMTLIASGTRGMGEANTLILSVIGLSPVAYMLMLLTFPAALVGLYLGWKLVHNLPLTALHTAYAKFRWSRALQAFIFMWLVLGTYGFVMSRFSDNPPNFIFDAERFLPYAILSLLLLPIQSATEEIVVRGYMNKGLIHWFGNKWVVFTLTSGLFMVLHLANPEAQAGAAAGNLPIVMSGYFFFGFAMCLMVLMDDGLESAIGVHAGNNTFAAIFVNYENSVLPTPSVWQATPEPTSDAITVIIILSIVLGLLYITRKPAPTASAA